MNANKALTKLSSYTTFKILLLILASSFLVACSSVPEEPKIPFVYTVNAAEDINPDIRGEASSVVLKVFQLSELGLFTAARYEDVFSDSYAKLGTEFIAVNEHLLNPATSQTFSVEISERAKFLGIAVAYRSTDSVVWKTTHMVPKKSLVSDPLGFLSTNGIIISVDKLSVSVAAL